MRKNDDALRPSIAAVEGDAVRFNSAYVCLLGPGGAGKSAALLAMQDAELELQRHSTSGGDSTAFEFLDVNRGVMVGLRAVAADVSHLRRLIHQRVAAWTDGSATSGGVCGYDLAKLVDGRGSFAKLQTTPAAKCKVIAVASNVVKGEPQSLLTPRRADEGRADQGGPTGAQSVHGISRSSPALSKAASSRYGGDHSGSSSSTAPARASVDVGPVFGVREMVRS